MHISIHRSFWRLREPLIISRGSIQATCTVTAEVRDGAHIGRGECCPTDRNAYHEGTSIFSRVFGESDVTEMIRLWVYTFAMNRSYTARTVQRKIQKNMSAGAARNALDCALWDVEAKKTGISVWSRLQSEYSDIFAGASQTAVPQCICATVSIDTPHIMAARALVLAQRYPLLKIKLGKKVRAGESTDSERLVAIRAAVPAARLIVDANEGWTQENLAEHVQVCEKVGVELIEQPVPAGREKWLAQITTHIPFCADESFHTSTDFERIMQYYQAVNIKLDKTGGLTEALACAREAKKRGLKIISGCMLGTSLSLAPQFCIAQVADYVDADCAHLLEKDIEHGMQYKDGFLCPPSRDLWG